MKIKYKNVIKDHYTVNPTGVKTRFNNHDYLHFQGEKIVSAMSRNKNLKRALVWTIGSLGLGILFSANIQKYWTKALFGRVEVDYFVLKNNVSIDQIKLCKTKRQKLKNAINDNGLNPHFCRAVRGIEEAISKDKELVLLALSEFNNGRFVSPELKNAHKDVALKIMNWDDGACFKTLDPSLRKDPDFIIEAIPVREKVIDNIDFKPFRKDKNFFLKLIREIKDLSLLKHASDTILNDPDFIKQIEEIINKEISDFKFNSTTPQIIRKNKIIVQALVHKKAYYLGQADEAIRKDKGMALMFIKNDPRALLFISDSLRDNLDFVEPLLQKDGLLIGYISERLRSNRELALKVIVQNPQAYSKISLKLQKDTQFFMDAYKQSGCTQALIELAQTPEQLDQLINDYGSELNDEEHLKVEERKRHFIEISTRDKSRKESNPQSKPVTRTINLGDGKIYRTTWKPPERL